MSVNPSPSRTPFAWVQKRDGRIVPFDADEISRDVFAAAEALGRPDAFLARELTDGILHFLAGESFGNPPSTVQIGDVAVKVVRELGQPALARQFERACRKESFERPLVFAPGKSVINDEAKKEDPVHSHVETSTQAIKKWIKEPISPPELYRRASSRLLQEFSLEEVFSRDLAAAHREGLLTLTGLEAPLGLAACALPLPSGRETGRRLETATVLETFGLAQSLTGGFLVLDGLEHAVALRSASGPDAENVAQTLKLGAGLARLGLVLNVNCHTPPPWAEDLAAGPLFSFLENAPPEEKPASLLHSITTNLLSILNWGPCTRINFHVAADDLGFSPPGDWSAVLCSLQQRIPVTFVFDRPEEPVLLAEGIDRRTPGVLIAIGVDLLKLAQQEGPGPGGDRFINRLGSLVRLALNAAAQKRDFLKKQSQAMTVVHRGFLIDRARTVVVPLGLEEATRTFIGHEICASGAALDFAKRVLHRLNGALEQDGPSYLLDACLDAWPAHGDGYGVTADAESKEATQRFQTALSPRTSSASARQQLKAAGALHAIAGRGTAVIRLSDDQPLDARELQELLHYAWEQTRVSRVSFLGKSVGAPERSSTPAMPSLWS